MKPPSRRTISIAVAVLGIAVVVAAGFALKDRLVVEWYIWDFESADLAERESAAEALVDLGAVNAIPHLLNALDFEERHGLFTVGSHLFPGKSQYQESIALAVLRIARKRTADSISHLVAGLQHDESDVREVSAFVLGDLGSEARESIPALEVLLRDQDVSVRDSANEALKRIHGEIPRDVQARWHAQGM